MRKLKHRIDVVSIVVLGVVLPAKTSETRQCVCVLFFSLLTSLLYFCKLSKYSITSTGDLENTEQTYI